MHHPDQSLSASSDDEAESSRMELGVDLLASGRTYVVEGHEIGSDHAVLAGLKASSSNMYKVHTFRAMVAIRNQEDVRGGKSVKDKYAYWVRKLGESGKGPLPAMTTINRMQKKPNHSAAKISKWFMKTKNDPKIIICQETFRSFIIAIWEELPPEAKESRAVFSRVIRERAFKVTKDDVSCLFAKEPSEQEAWISPQRSPSEPRPVETLPGMTFRLDQPDTTARKPILDHQVVADTTFPVPVALLDPLQVKGRILAIRHARFAKEQSRQSKVDDQLHAEQQKLESNREQEEANRHSEQKQVNDQRHFEQLKLLECRQVNSARMERKHAALNALEDEYLEEIFGKAKRLTLGHDGKAPSAEEGLKTEEQEAPSAEAGLKTEEEEMEEAPSAEAGLKTEEEEAPLAEAGLKTEEEEAPSAEAGLKEEEEEEEEDREADFHSPAQFIVASPSIHEKIAADQMASAEHFTTSKQVAALSSKKGWFW